MGRASIALIQARGLQGEVAACRPVSAWRRTWELQAQRSARRSKWIQAKHCCCCGSCCPGCKCWDESAPATFADRALHLQALTCMTAR